MSSALHDDPYLHGRKNVNMHNNLKNPLKRVLMKKKTLTRWIQHVLFKIIETIWETVNKAIQYVRGGVVNVKLKL